MKKEYLLRVDLIGVNHRPKITIYCFKLHDNNFDMHGNLPKGLLCGTALRTSSMNYDYLHVLIIKGNIMECYSFSDINITPNINYLLFEYDDNIIYSKVYNKNTLFNKKTLFNKLKQILNNIWSYLRKIFVNKIAIDIESINNISDGHKRLNVLDIISFYFKKNILIYRSVGITGKKTNPPQLLSRGLFSSKPVIIDFNKLSKEDKNKILNKI